MDRASEGMRRFWDDAAKKNAAWYVDTSISFEEPDMEAFFETGRTIVDNAYSQSPVAPSGHALAVEIGSGLGRNCRALADRFDEVIGVDISPEMVEQARVLVPDERVQFVVGQGADLSAVDTGSADFVMSFTVFQHIPEVSIIQAYLREGARVLRPGGVFAFQWNNQAPERRWRLRRALLSTLQRTGLRREAHDRNATQFLGTTVNLDRVRSTLAADGLEVLRIDGEGTLFCWAWAVKE